MPREPRGVNRERLTDVLRREGAATQAQLVRATGLSRTTVTSLLDDLRADGLIVEEQASAPGRRRGRPARRLRLDAGALPLVAGVELGRRHVAAAVADGRPCLLAERRTAIDPDAAPADVLEQAAALVSVALHDLGVQPDRLAAVGVSLPAPVDPSSGLPLSRALLPSWAGVGVGAELSTRLGTRVTVDNDANLETLAEWRHGAGVGSEDLIYVKLSHGIGAGLVLGGRLRRGAAGMAGELGHVRVRDDGVVCRCGNRGCLGTVASVTALIELLRGIHGPDLDLDGVLALLGRGDAGARRTVADAGRALGMALGTLCNLVNPELIVVGGELSGDESPLLDGVREGIDRYAVPAAAEAVTVRAGALGRRAVLLGAVSAALEESDSTQAAAVAAS